ncbi:hypothetical protein DFH08DRAFT_686877, partial [Mycena albidolilacea]
LAYICQSWRQAALSYPLFWNSVDISSFSKSRHLLSKLENQLVRSSNVSLDVFWGSGSSSKGPLDTHLLASFWSLAYLMLLGLG